MNAHPYAEAWPLLTGDDLAELVEDIKAHGLQQPIVSFGDDLILDGRNRFAACELAGVKPTFVRFEGDEDAALAFVLSINGQRRHQSAGSRYASKALTLLAASRREDGRWKRGSVGIGGSVNSAEQARLKECGVIADHLGPLALEAVRDDIAPLSRVYEDACSERDEALRRRDGERKEAAREQKAERFLKDTAPELAGLVGTTYETFLEAEAVWTIRNREEAAARAEAQRKAAFDMEQRERGLRDGIQALSMQLINYAGGSAGADVFVRDFLPHLDRYPTEAKRITAENLEAAIDYFATIRKAL